MCGISGIWNFRDRSGAEAVVAKMNDALAHRGPDAAGLWSNEMVVLGHRRLSIIDTSPAGNQPFFSKEKDLAMVFNGEIYNYVELKLKLENEFEFVTHSDTEVMIAAYRKWGIACVDHFLGMFAFALWDENIKTLFVVRDRLGIKPIYYSVTDQGLIFSSELRPILASGLVKKKISPESLADYLRYQTVHAPDTIVCDVKMVMPGHFMRCAKNDIDTKCYWKAEEKASRDVASLPKDKIQKHIVDLLHSSVEIRMRADVPFGAFLSGGIDSSIVVGLMSRISAHPVKTFSVTFREEEFDESSFSNVIAKKFHTDHTEIKLSANNFLELVPEALAAMDHPSGDGPNTYVVSKVTRASGVKMALSGLGGDELFAGYDVFRRMKELEHKRWLKLAPKFARTLSGKFLSALKPSVSSEKIAESLRQPEIDFAHLYPLTRQVFLDEAVMKLLNGNFIQDNPVKKTIRQISASWLPLLSKVSVAEISTYMQNVLLRDTDQMSMAHSLEVRVPFLDHRLVEFVLGVSDDVKFPYTPKQLLTESLGDLLPREIIDRKKMGFTFPWSAWMKNELRYLCESNLKALEAIPILNQHEVQNLWKKFLAGDSRITWSRIWPLVVLGNWIKQHDVC